MEDRPGKFWVCPPEAESEVAETTPAVPVEPTFEGMLACAGLETEVAVEAALELATFVPLEMTAVLGLPAVPCDDWVKVELGFDDPTAEELPRICWLLPGIDEEAVNGDVCPAGDDDPATEELPRFC